MSSRDGTPSSGSRRRFLRVALASLSAAVVAGCDKLGATPWFGRFAYNR